MERQKVLVADSEETNRELLSVCLKEDYIIDEAKNGEEVLQKLKTYGSEYVAMLLDLQLSNENECDILAYMNKKDLIEKIPVIIITNESNKEQEKECLMLGASEYIRKPFEPIIVKKRVENVIRIRNNRENLESQVRIIDLLSENFYFIFHVDLVMKSYYVMTKDENVKKITKERGMVHAVFQQMIETFVDESYQEIVREFVTMKHVIRQLMNRDNLALEYLDRSNGWCRMEFHVASRNAAGSPLTALFTSRNINDEKNGETLQQHNQSWFSEKIYYETGDKGNLLSDKQNCINSTLSGKYAVGIVGGFYDEELTIYTISEYAIQNLHDSYESFHKRIQGKFKNLVHPDDLYLVQNLIHSFSDDRIVIRLFNNQGKAMWFEAGCYQTLAKNGQGVWFLSLRPVNDTMAGTLCEQDYDFIGMIDCKRQEWNIEKVQNVIQPKEIVWHSNYNWLIDFSCEYLLRPEDIPFYREQTTIQNLKKKLNSAELYEFIMYHRYPDGKYYPVRHKYRYLDKERELILVTEENMSVLAEIDEVTGAYNENGFYHYIERRLAQSRDVENYALIAFKIPGFMLLSSMLDSEEVDAFLKKTYNCIQASKIMPKYIGRIRNGDFLCLVRRKNITEERIQKLCDSEVLCGENTLKTGLRAGIYQVERNWQHIKVKNMCDKAFLAAESVEKDKIVSYAHYTTAMDKQYRETAMILELLPKALRKRQFQVYYQPIFDARSKEIVSAEALVRWSHPINGMISPGVFIPALEGNGHITELDMYMHFHIREFLEKRYLKNKTIVPVAFNLSRLDFLNEPMMKQLIQSIDEMKIPSAYIRAEVTESSDAEIGDTTLKVLQQLRTRGIKILMDDFGTGYSSLAGITNEMFDIIKIDMSFIRKIGDIRTEAIIRQSISLAHEIGCKVVCEGVETQEQYMFLRAVGCDMIQGYYFSKPVPEEEFADILDHEPIKIINA